MTILTDIVHFGLFYADSEVSLFRFSGGMAILSLLLKPVSCFFVYQMYRERGGEYNVNFGKWVTGGPGEKEYWVTDSFWSRVLSDACESLSVRLKWQHCSLWFV